ncbi:PD-(D/E)XK nuclease family protein (plasmid) [Haloarcula salina]|uniref:PD-(D/E)XK nuclease family protein n=1 Tax=Haloarcula salina TaxID=1429914 RepID=UPI003C6FF99D
MSSDRLKDKIESHSNEYGSICEKDNPKRILEILDIQHKEKSWHRLLEYYITPTEQHGFGPDILEAVLETISSEHPSFGIQNQRRELTDVIVESEVSIESGQPDLIIYLPNEWLMCIEIKLDAGEGHDQTKRYVEQSWISARFEPGLEEKYIYLAPKGKSSDHDSFSDVPWESVIRMIQQTVGQQLGQYPLTSATQLTEFLETAETKLNMKDTHTDSDTIEKARLRLKHADAINETHQAFTSLQEEMINDWPNRLLQQYQPSEWSEKWNCGRGKDSKHGQIYRTEWRRGEEMETTANTSEAAVKLQFVHKIKNAKDLLNGDLIFKIKWPRNKPTDTDLQRAFRDQLMDEKDDELAQWINEHGIKIVNSGGVITKSTYDFNQDKFPTSYYETLSEAFDEHAEIADLLTRTLNCTIRKHANSTDQ